MIQQFDTLGHSNQLKIKFLNFSRRFREKCLKNSHFLYEQDSVGKVVYQIVLLLSNLKIKIQNSLLIFMS